MCICICIYIFISIFVVETEGVKECDKRHISNVLQSVAVVKENAYHLMKHLWSEVNEEWSFYSEEEKATLQR